jgi:hypothetical protein
MNQPSKPQEEPERPAAGDEAPETAKQPLDPLPGLRRACAELEVEHRNADSDYRAVLMDGADHMHSAYPVVRLRDRPLDLDHYAFHMDAMSQALDQHGLKAKAPNAYLRFNQEQEKEAYEDGRERG